jgi:rhodanese-related sulfurtransferase
MPVRGVLLSADTMGFAMAGTPTRVLVLLIVTSGAAAFANAVRPDALPWVRNPETSINPGENLALRQQVTITLDEIREYFFSGEGVFVDARKPDEYAEGHLAGSINVPSTEKENYLEVIFQMLPPESIIVIYCGGGGCEASNEVFEFLVGNGFSKDYLKIFEEGWAVISKQDDLPIVVGSEP